MKMTSLTILWTLLFLATVRARSEVSIAEAALDSEKTWSGVPLPKDEDSLLKSDVNSQHNANVEEVLLSRIGLGTLDALTHSISNRLTDNEGVDLEKLQDLSQTLGRLSGLEPNDVSSTNYENLANLKTRFSDAYQGNLNNNVLNPLDGGADELLVVPPLSNGVPLLPKAGRLNVLNRNRYLNSVRGFPSRLGKRYPLYSSVPGRGYKQGNVNEEEGTSLLLDVPSDGLVRQVVSRRLLSKNDPENVNAVQDVTAIHEIFNNRRGFVDPGKVYRNGQLHNIVPYNLEYNALNAKTGSVDVDRDLASVVVNVRAGDNGLNELNKLNSLYDDSNGVKVFDHLIRHGSETNRNDLMKVSLNDLNDAKRLLGPLSLDKVTIANRVSNEVDGALLNALNTEDKFNALGALLVLNKAAAAGTSENLNSLGLNNVNSRNGVDVESNVLSRFGGPEDVDVNVVPSNPLQQALNRLVVLSKADSANDVESAVNSAYNLENLGRSHKNLLHNLIGSKSDPVVDDADVDNLLSKVSNRLNNQKYKKLLLPTRVHRLYGKGYRPSKLYNVPRYWYKSRPRSGLNKDENLNDLVELSRLAKLNEVNDNASVKEDENEDSLGDLLSALGKNSVSDVPAVLSKAQLNNLLVLQDRALPHGHSQKHLYHVNDEDDVVNVRQAVSKLDKELTEAKNLLLAGNLKDQRRNVSGKSNLKSHSAEEENKFDNVVLVPVRVDGGSVVKGAGDPLDLSDLINLGEFN